MMAMMANRSLQRRNKLEMVLLYYRYTRGGD